MIIRNGGNRRKWIGPRKISANQVRGNAFDSVRIIRSDEKKVHHPFKHICKCDAGLIADVRVINVALVSHAVIEDVTEDICVRARVPRQRDTHSRANNGA